MTAGGWLRWPWKRAPAPPPAPRAGEHDAHGQFVSPKATSKRRVPRDSPQWRQLRKLPVRRRGGA